MARGGPRKAGGPSKKGAKAAVTLLTAVDAEDVEIPPMPDPAQWLIMPAPRQRPKKDQAMVDAMEVDDPTEESFQQEWFEPVVQWWNDIWTSPMSNEFVDSDIHGLYLACYYLHESLNPWYKLTERLTAAKMFEATVKNYGLNPSSREQLRWSVAQGTAAQNRTNHLRKSMSDGIQKSPAEQAEAQDQMRDLFNRHG